MRRATSEEYYSELTALTYRVRMLTGIVQNDGVTVSPEELAEWRSNANSVINDLSCICEGIVKHLSK